MQKHWNLLCIGVFVLFLAACAPESPQHFFEQAVLNTNLVNDFDPKSFGRTLEQNTIEYPDIPSSKKKGDEAQEVVKMKILTSERALENIKKLSANDDETKAIKENSIALFEMVIPVYKNEYMQYAKLCDTKGSAEEKAAILTKIEQNYAPKVYQQLDALYQKGKVYAEKNDIEVNWGR
ncbi:hypothetical protein SAMN05444266_104149 [Chitinophaga jiangningensis]|uniref:Lipoprotein n=1 Tax=Chitinophaga jiangningensis TaxID=1419482 RepID=A0A1M7C0W7_9BACT|nr:hypothetical protein [Chitinophaga jiangningensis]SHL60786.1 hypothetical protein SAMN05444266_104149 [Chitinophaga jiangningensis]